VALLTICLHRYVTQGLIKAKLLVMTKILIVEDDPAISETVAYNLVSEGYQIQVASDGLEGLELAREMQPDLVILDIMLPKMSGLDVCRMLKKESDHKILMMTARDSEVDILHGFDCGADDYVTKPFSMRLMKARAAALLRRGEPVLERQEFETNAAEPAPRAAIRSDENTLLVAENVELDSLAREVRVAGNIINMRPREFDLLEYLMRHPRQALSREMLLESVWGYTFLGDTRTVDVHIRWLRKKIEVDPAKPQRLVTVRSIGYKFIP